MELLLRWCHEQGQLTFNEIEFNHSIRPFFTQVIKFLVLLRVMPGRISYVIFDPILKILLVTIFLFDNV